jgi:hypothetical protein
MVSASTKMRDHLRSLAPAFRVAAICRWRRKPPGHHARGPPRRSVGRGVVRHHDLVILAGRDGRGMNGVEVAPSSSSSLYAGTTNEIMPSSLSVQPLVAGSFWPRVL